jgi:hypothetical protein
LTEINTAKNEFLQNFKEFQISFDKINNYLSINELLINQIKESSTFVNDTSAFKQKARTTLQSIGLEDVTKTKQDIVKQIEKIPNVVYLPDNVVVVDGVAILGTNGWWGFDFDLTVNPTQSALWWQEKMAVSSAAVKSVARTSTKDATYMVTSVRRLQAHADIKKIIMVTHTVPLPELIQHDIDLDGSLRFNCMGNAYMQQALLADFQEKIHTWCFGHYHGSIDQIHHGVRFVNNCRGRADSPYNQYVYNPRRIIVDLN